MSTEAKQAVHDFWQRASCGEEAYARGSSSRERLEAQARARYELEPYIRQFARFESGRGLDVLEVGVGMGADHLEWARHMPRSLSGIDLTERAIAHTATRLALYGLRSDLRVADAENLPFPAASFDLAYPWGVLHHSPDTPRAVRGASSPPRETTIPARGHTAPATHARAHDADRGDALRRQRKVDLYPSSVMAQPAWEARTRMPASTLHGMPRNVASPRRAKSLIVVLFERRAEPRSYYVPGDRAS